MNSDHHTEVCPVECMTWCITLNWGQGDRIQNLRTDGMTIGNASLINNSFTVALVKYINRSWHKNWIKRNSLVNKMNFYKIFSLFVLFSSSNATRKQSQWGKESFFKKRTKVTESNDVLYKFIGHVWAVT